MRSRRLVIGMHKVKLWGDTRGTTLVEILVVMVVLLIGILTMIQLFPTGFRVVRAAESQTIATRLAQQELERWKNMAANLPAGILPIDENGNVLNDQDPGPPFHAYRKDASGNYIITNGRLERGNALNCRQVIDETTLIPLASHFRTEQGTLYGSRYTLAFSPIDAWRDNNNRLQGITIKSGDLRRRVAESSFDPPYLRPGEYAIDYDLSQGQDYSGKEVFHVAFPRDPGIQRIYYISYSYWASTDPDNPNVEPELFSRVDQLVVRNGESYIDGDDGDWIEVPIEGVPTGYTVIEVEPYTETCARGFLEDDGNAPPNDPYRFRLVDSIVGVIAFNPVGYGLYEYTAKGIRPIEARISYLINDPRILREDRVVPQPQPGATEIPVKLALRFILNIGDPTNDLAPGNPPEEQTYKGLMIARDGSVAIPLPVLIIDLPTGLRVDLPNNAIDFKAGVVRLPLKANLIDYAGQVQARNVDLPGRHLRFFYRADGDWSVQCRKAYTTYMRKYAAGDLDYRTYRIRVDPNDRNRLVPRLLFAPCEGLKTVAVDYSYIDPNGVERKVAGEAHQIDLARDNPSDGWCVDLLKNAPPGSYISRNARIVVVGVSFTARVIWRDGKTWRHVDMDTQLTKS